MLSRGLIRTRLSTIRALNRATFCSSSILSTELAQNSWRPFNSPDPIPVTPSGEYDAAIIAMQKKAKIRHDVALKKRKLVNPALHLREGSNEEILQLEVEELLQAVTPEGGSIPKVHHEPEIELFTEVELDIVQLSSTGDGLAYTASKDHVVVIPFSIPGDRVLGKIYKWLGNYSHADFVKVIEPSKSREGTTPKCKYFADCGGCQLQMISYEQQLAHKKTILENAFRRFSGLSDDKIPPVRDTMGSPLQYHYRTKLTPHFDGPSQRKGGPRRLTTLPKIGYCRKNRKEVIDIEHCPIGTDILQEGLKIERAKVAVNYTTYANGKTILLRESTRRERTNKDADNEDAFPVAEFDTTSTPTSTDLHLLPSGAPEITLTFPTYKEHKTYTSVETSLSNEYIGPHRFVNRAGSFFQNNNSILGPFTQYIHDNSMHPDTTSSQPPIKYLLDAYCGSGLFTITLSKLFTSALGIDIDGRGIEAARSNAANNKIPNAGFIEADAANLFADVPFPPDQSLVIIDPPRKGASEDFLRQLCQFRAKRVVYVSCNVHTQARDVGMIVKGFGGAGSCRYEIESLRGFDFFPQTGHVEGVCVLNRVDEVVIKE